MGNLLIRWAKIDEMINFCWWVSPYLVQAEKCFVVGGGDVDDILRREGRRFRQGVLMVVELGGGEDGDDDQVKEQVDVCGC